MLIAIVIALFLFVVLLVSLNNEFVILAVCRRVKTVDGSSLNSKVFKIPGKTIFGNNFDVLTATPEKAYKFLRENVKKSKGKSYLMYFLWSPVLSVITAEDAEELLQSQSLITKSVMYDALIPFLGRGLLISTDEQWHFRRKLLTPAFHFNILVTFLEIFKEETHKFVDVLSEKADEIISLSDIIPHFALNNVCETALGVKLDEIPGSDYYRKSVKDIETLAIHRVCNPIMYFDWIYCFTKEHKELKRLVKITNDFSTKIIQKRREEFQQSRSMKEQGENVDEFGKKKRYAMLDTLLKAETEGLIDHQGICDEVNIFMFAGYDTTSTCLMMTLLFLSLHQDIQQKCFQEVQNLGNIDDITLFDLNKLEYLECVIKETLRLCPSVPFIARSIVKETVLNGLILPAKSQVHVHILDIMRDERHFPEPLKFKPERFLPENTTNRHPFTFIPFSAGPRNCIGQKFAMLEMKLLLTAILKDFQLLPITRFEDLTFENALVLRTKEKIKVKVALRK